MTKTGGSGVNIILFHGDSVTDVGRVKDDSWDYGQGYPHYVMARLSCRRPDTYRFYNKGVAGYRVTDIYEHMAEDILAVRPSTVSLLVGVNDALADAMGLLGDNAFSVFESTYDKLLSELRAALPELRLIVMEPFITHGETTDEQYDAFYTEVRRRAAVVRQLADKHGAVFVPLQECFDRALARADASHWTWDGVHPTESAGHELIARAWLCAYEKLS